MNITSNNYAFIDGQNVHVATKMNGWFIDYQKFKVYLKDKYNVSKVFYFWGYYKKENIKIYRRLSKLNYIQIFKEHNSDLRSNKKGNVDSNLVFEIMKKTASESKFNKVILVSGDGDYKKLVNYLKNNNKLIKILFPSKESASSLYKRLGSELYDYLDNIKKDINFDL